MYYHYFPNNMIINTYRPNLLTKKFFQVFNYKFNFEFLMLCIAVLPTKLNYYPVPLLKTLPFSRNIFN